jgi:NAD(P)-dependent dehydrogenase (short-subunit alcohol dehydrogenase family)
MPTVLVTGATDGLGRALTERLAGEGHTVLAHARNEQRGCDALGELLDGVYGDVRLVTADFASLAEVRALADQLPEQLHALVNNAGIGSANPTRERAVSADGYELRFAVNYLAGFLLTALARDRLIAAAPARIVNVASAGQMAIDFDNVMLEHGYSGIRAYCQSKLAEIMHAFDLAQELHNDGVTANALHPATFMPTKMVHAAGTTPASALEDGVAATWRLVADPALGGTTGRYFSGTTEAPADPQAYDPAARRTLRELSERLIGQST